MPRHIVDLGCGPGSITALLDQAYRTPENPDVQIVGIDSSAEMLETAAKRDENIEWQQADIAQWEADNPVDILFSNAALQWIPEHAKLFPA